MAHPALNSKLVLTSKKDITIIDFEDIIFIRANGRYSEISTNRKKYLVCKHLKFLEDQMDENFFRIDKSYVINISKIHSISNTKIFLDHYEIPISISKKRVLANYLLKYRENS